MNTNKQSLIFAICFGLVLSVSSATAQTFKIKDFYQLADGNEWRYTAPSGWKDGDYVSRIVEDKNQKIFRHYDATKAAKLLRFEKDGIYYLGEEFANAESVAKFDKPILWFPAKLKIGDEIKESREFTRVFQDGKTVRGNFQIQQKVVALESVKVTAGEFTNALRIESETLWNLGDGRKARSINVYHYAKKIGVIKASARFIIMNEEGKEIINRLVETDLKSYRIQK